MSNECMFFWSKPMTWQPGRHPMAIFRGFFAASFAGHSGRRQKRDAHTTKAQMDLLASDLDSARPIPQPGDRRNGLVGLQQPESVLRNVGDFRHRNDSAKHW